MIEVVVTDAGRQALVNASATGSNAVTVTHVGVGSGAYVADATRLELEHELKRLPIVSGGNTSDSAIHVAYMDESEDTYEVHEFGLFLDDGTLFALYSSEAPVLTKTAHAAILLAVDIAFSSGIDAGLIQFGDVTFSNPAATTDRAGVVELATPAEAAAGASSLHAVTPEGLRAGVEAFAVTPAALAALVASTGAAGIVELATTAEAQAGTDASRAVTPAGLRAALNARVVSATDSAAGIVELATAAEAQAGTDATRAVTPAAARAAIDARIDALAASPADVTAALDARVVAATATTAGIVELATTAEAQTGSDSTRAVTPAGVRSALSSYSGALSAASIRTVAFDTSGRVTNAGGAANMSLYPSGLNQHLIARAGTNQLALARFTNDDAGTSLVFLKSRSTTVGTSKSAIAGDIIGQMSFLADNGRLDYSGSTQGALAARIVGGVFENSTLSSSGTSNVGVRGVLRFEVCSDTNSRDGVGLELLDNTLRPTVDDTIGLGTAARRWKSVYAMTDVISTSDETLKRDIQDIPEAVLDAWGEVGWCQYRLKEDEGIFFGVVAQRIVAAFAAHGLDARMYGLIDEEELDDGTVVLGVRYREAFALEAAWQRRRMAALEARLSALENKGGD